MRALIDEFVTGFYSQDQKDDLYDLLEAEKQIFEWKAHTLRSINQEAAIERNRRKLKGKFRSYCDGLGNEISSIKISRKAVRLVR